MLTFGKMGKQQSNKRNFLKKNKHTLSKWSK